jgi:hypothetical protein
MPCDKMLALQIQFLLVLQILEVFIILHSNTTTFNLRIGKNSAIHICEIRRFHCPRLLSYGVNFHATLKIDLIEADIRASSIAACHDRHGVQRTR